MNEPDIILSLTIGALVCGAGFFAVTAITTADPDGPIRPMLRPAPRVPENIAVADLLRQMQARHSHMAILIDHGGATTELVTIEDLLEELVGDIRDEDDPP